MGLGIPYKDVISKYKFNSTFEFSRYYSYSIGDWAIISGVFEILKQDNPNTKFYIPSPSNLRKLAPNYKHWGLGKGIDAADYIDLIYQNNPNVSTINSFESKPFTDHFRAQANIEIPLAEKILLRFGYTPDELKHLLTSQNIFMFPFCINIEDLRTMIDDFVELSSKIYLEEECWEADMYAIVISAFKNNIKIEGSNFGCCTNWNKYVNLDFKMVHYPSKIFNNKNNKIFYKQDFTKDTYTIPWILNISPNQTKNKINYQLIATIKEFISLQKIRTNCPDMLYWNSDVTYNTNSYRTDNKYVILKPWSGGGLSSGGLCTTK